MAGARKGTGLESRAARLRLAAQHSPHWVNLGPGLSLGYRRLERAGAWYCRRYLGNGRYEQEHLGHADDYADPNGDSVLTYYQASEKAREFAKRREQQHGIGITKDITVAEAAAHYMKWFRVHRKGVETAERNIEAFILPAFGDKKVSSLKKRTIADWRDQVAAAPARRRARAGQAPAFRAAPQTDDQKRARRATANRILAVFKALLNKAADDDLILPRGPWVDVKLFRLVDKPVERFLTPIEAERLLQACATDFRALVHGALFTGCRYAELTNLRVADVTIEDNGGRIYIREAKSGKPRYIPLSSEGRGFFAAVIAGKVGAVGTADDRSLRGRDPLPCRPQASASISWWSGRSHSKGTVSGYRLQKSSERSDSSRFPTVVMFRKLRTRRDTPHRGNSGEIGYEHQFQGYSPGIQLNELQGRCWKR